MEFSAPRLRPAAIAIVAALSLTISAAAQTPAKVGIDNFARVNDSYYRGAQPVGDDFAALAALGVKTVINLTSHDAMDDEKALVENHGMRYVQIPMNTRIAPTRAQLDQFLSVANDSASQPVYVHCVGGRHRTGVMTAIYRMTKDGISGDAAFREMKQFKYGPDFLHPEFKKFVQTYDVKKAAAAAATQQQ
jgi:protein tyrosine/serine phosphatase